MTDRMTVPQYTVHGTQMPVTNGYRSNTAGYLRGFACNRPTA